MGSFAVPRSAALGRWLRTKRKQAGLTIREVALRLEETGPPIPMSTLGRIEQGRLDPGVRRLYRLLRLYDVPPHLAADLVELEEMAADEVIWEVDEDLETLYRKGAEYWKQGDIGRGLACLFAVREHVPVDHAAKLLRQKATLTFAVAARGLSKNRLARELVNDLLCEPPDPSLLVHVLVLAASLWRHLGAREVAHALIDRAETRLQPGDTQHRAWVLHQKAALELDDGNLEQSKRKSDRAVKLYRELGDTYGELRALLLRVRTLKAVGKLTQALACARDVEKRAAAGGYAKLRINGCREIGRLLTDTGEVEGGLLALQETVAQAAVAGDRNEEFLAHYFLWKAHESLGDRDRARFELEAAKYFVRFVDGTGPEAVEVRGRLKRNRRRKRR